MESIQCSLTISAICLAIIFKILWKAYIDFEIAVAESERVRQLYERLLERTQHVKVCPVFIFCSLVLLYFDTSITC